MKLELHQRPSPPFLKSMPSLINHFGWLITHISENFWELRWYNLLHLQGIVPKCNLSSIGLLIISFHISSMSWFHTLSNFICEDLLIVLSKTSTHNFYFTGTWTPHPRSWFFTAHASDVNKKRLPDLSLVTTQSCKMFQTFGYQQ